MMIKIYHLLKEKVIKRANYAFRLEKIEMLYKDPSQSKAFKAEKKEKEWHKQSSPPKSQHVGCWSDNHYALKEEFTTWNTTRM